jgi:hypothetical protein
MIQAFSIIFIFFNIASPCGDMSKCVILTKSNLPLYFFKGNNRGAILTRHFGIFGENFEFF